jgi:hypothetical protein
MYEEQASFLGDYVEPKELSGNCIVAEIINKMIDSVVEQPGQV